MNILLYTFHSVEYTTLAAITETNKRRYAEKHGYFFIGDLMPVNTCPLKDMGHGRLKAIAGLLYHFHYFDYIFCTGCDSMITNYNIKLEDIIAQVPRYSDLIIANDALEWNCDSFIIRCSPASLKYFRRLVQAQSEPDLVCDQLMMIRFKDMINYKEVPQRLLNSYDYSFYKGRGPTAQSKANYNNGVDLLGNDGTWQPGDFLIHYPGISLDKRISLLTNMQQQVI